MSSVERASVSCSVAATPAVTVLIPAYNAGHLLRESVDSILAQTFADFECLVIDDGSTDGAVDALKTIDDPRLRILRNAQNLGLIATLNLGLELARAPLLARMDADDVSLPTRLERQVAEFGARPGLALLGTWAELMGADGTTAGFMRTPSSQTEVVLAVLRDNAFIHPSVMARTAVLRQLGGFPPDAQYAEDYALWLRVVARHETANLPEVLLRYRVHAGQVSQRKMRAQRAMAQQLQAHARVEFEASGVLPFSQQPPAPDWLDKLRARPGTLGSDYKHWAMRNWKLGDWRGGSAAALRGLSVAPLSVELWRMVTPPIVSPRYWLQRVLGHRQ